MFEPTTGAAGLIYRSAAESTISYKLIELGIVSHDTYYPQTFTDSNETEFRAMSDFKCPYTGIYFEAKSGHMNGLKSKASAESAMHRFNDALAKGYINKHNYNYKKLDVSWSNSVQKFKAVQDQLAKSGNCAVLLFDKAPDTDTISRLDRAKVFWCVCGDEAYKAFMSFRTLVKCGLRSKYIIKGHIFESHGGIIH